MEVLYHGIKTRYAYDFPHELIMSLRNIYIHMIYIVYIMIITNICQASFMTCLLKILNTVAV